MRPRITAHNTIPASLRSYRRVLAEPGAPRALTGAAVASVPIAVLGLTLLLMVQQRTGSLTDATVVSGASGAGTAGSIVVQGRLLDRFGARRLLRPLAIAQLVVLPGLVVAVEARAPLAVLTVLACCAGGCEQHVAGSLRGLWAFAVPGRRVAGMTLTSTVFEAAVVTGPGLLAGLLAITSPAVAVLVWGLCFGVGTVLLTGSEVAAAWRPAASSPARRRWPGSSAVLPVRRVVVVSAAQASSMAFLQVAAIVACQGSGRGGLVPWCAAAVTVGSLAGTVVLALLAGGGSPLARLPVLLAALLVVVSMTGVLSGTAGLLVGLVAVGSCAGPIGVSCLAVVAEVLPRERLVGGFTSVTAAGLVVAAASTMVAGLVAERGGAHAGFLAASALSGTAAVASLSMRRRTR